MDLGSSVRTARDALFGSARPVRARPRFDPRDGDDDGSETFISSRPAPSSTNVGGTSRVDRNLQRQDQDLDELHSHLQKIGSISQQISKDLESQNVMLDDIETGMDGAQDRLDVVLRKTTHLVESAGGPRYFMIIAMLSIVALALFLMLLN